MSSLAISPCPYPKEMIFNLVGSISHSLAKLRRYVMGSAPGDNTNMMGVVHSES